MTTAIAIDIGGSSIKSAVVTRVGDLYEVDQESTRRVENNDVGSLRDAVLESIGSLTLDPSVPVGIATTGSVRRSGVVAKGAFFEDYENFAWKDVIQQHFGAISTSVLNDGQAAALGSYAAEHPSRPDPFAFFVIGTGIGGGLVVGGDLVRGADGFAGAFGHIKVRVGKDVPCSCSRFGCVENVASGRALAGRGISAGGTFVRGTVEDLHRALLENEPAAIAAFKRVGEGLGLAIADVANMINPEVVAVGGGLVSASAGQAGTNHLLAAAQDTAQRTCTPRIAERLRVEQSRLKNPNLIGAAVNAWRDHLPH